MVRNYQRKTDRGEYSKMNMKDAIGEVISRNMGYRKASAFYGVPQTTLERLVKTLREKGEVNLNTSLGPFKPIFSYDEERQLVEYSKSMVHECYQLTKKDFQILAFHFADKLGKKNNFNRSKAMAGTDWLMCFLKRHPDTQLISVDTSKTLLNNQDQQSQMFLETFGNVLNNQIPRISGVNTEDGTFSNYIPTHQHSDQYFLRYHHCLIILNRFKTSPENNINTKINIPMFNN